MPFVITLIDLGDIMLSEISRQRKTNTVLFHLYVEPRQTKQNRSRLIDTVKKLIVAIGKGWGSTHEKDQGE